MALDKPYLDIPGTVVFDAAMARTGYHANQFCMSLMKPDNRQRFLADESAYLDEWSMSQAQKEAIIKRDYSTLLELGGNVYYFSKLFFTDHKSVQFGSSQMAGMSEEDYVRMMVSGGRSLDGNRYIGDNDDG